MSNKREKVRICINLPGTIKNGYYSPERGESRWAQNLLCILGRRDYDVIGCSVARPEWGDCEILSSVKFCSLTEAKQESHRKMFDILFDSSWFHPGMTEFYSDFNADVFLHGHWGGCCLEEPGRFPDERHYIVYPNLQVSQSMLSCAFIHRNRHLFLPMPLIFRVENWVKKKEKVLTWCIKEAFYKRKEQNLRERALRLWRVCDELYEKHDVMLHVLQGDQLVEETSENDLSYVENLRNTRLMSKAVFYGNYTAYDIVQRILFNSSVLFRTGEPPGAPMEYEAVAMGCLPLIWKSQQHPFSKYYDCFGLTLSDELSFGELKERIEVLMFDERVRKQLWEMCKVELSLHFDYKFIEDQLFSVLK